MTATTDSDLLRGRMQRIRNRMHAKVDGLRLDAESLLDWRYYVCQYPLSSVLAAAAVGFWLTPGHRVMPTVKLDDRTIDNIVDRGAVRMPPPPPKPSWWSALVPVATNLILKSALAFVGQQLIQHTVEARAEVSETTR
jgi:hypothetical protein